MLMDAGSGDVRWTVPPTPGAPLQYQGEASDDSRVYLVRRREDDNAYLAEATIDYLLDMKPKGWIDLLLHQVARAERKRQREVIAAMKLHRRSFDGADADRLRAFFEPRVDSTRCEWARRTVLALLARLGPALAETEIREMFWSSHGRTAITGIDLVKRMEVADWAQCIARRALDGNVDIRERALYEIAGLPWHPAFDAVVTRIANKAESRDLVFAALAALGNPENPSSDRSHHVRLWNKLKLKLKSLPREDVLSAATEGPEDLTVELDGLGSAVTHVVGRARHQSRRN